MPSAVAAFLNYNRPDLAAAMLAQLPPPRCLVNNGGSEPLPAGAIRLDVPENRFFSGGWNHAMAHLAQEYDYVWMLNDDVVIERADEVLRALVASFPKGAAAVTPAFNSPHALFQRQGVGLRRVSWIDWTGPLVATQAWREVGPFDERFRGYGADLDWCRRAREKGWSFWVHDDYKFHHLGSQTAARFGLQGIQGNVEEMNRLLKEKWNVRNWTEMT